MTKTNKVDMAEVVRQALKERGVSARAAALQAGLPVRRVQGVLEGHHPSIHSAAQICDALGLELYIGPPRAGDTSPPPSGDGAVSWGELRRRLVEAADLAEKLGRRENLSPVAVTQIDVVRMMVGALLQASRQTAGRERQRLGNENATDTEALRSVVLGLLEGLRQLADRLEP